MSVTYIESAQRKENGSPVLIPGRMIAQFECAKDAMVCMRALTAHHGKPFTVTPGIDMMYAVRPMIAERLSRNGGKDIPL
jgi:hypothetical protein